MIPGRHVLAKLREGDPKRAAILQRLAEIKPGYRPADWQAEMFIVGYFDGERLLRLANG
jgi:hypothetical protein